jgi:AraC family transcriptional regulator of adaptative response / DNA-3-methyladenine glycosylase II
MHLDREACYRALLTRDARFDGQFFIAVRTTGIYCRPICPARAPKLEHIEFMPSAAAAQAAGYRSCLRCRPETSPQLAAWHGTYSTVSRAMALIAAGALNGEAVDRLAGRLGIGERQLRRLFRKHLGASPNAVAQTGRVLFAKQLISDTTLSMTEVTLAAGFGSVRRFNDTFQKLYGRPPSNLRRDGPVATIGSAVNLTLTFKPPYDWAAIIGFLATRAIPGVECVRGDEYARTVNLGGATGTIVVRPAMRQHALSASIRFPAVAALPAIVERIRRLFDLGADPAVIGAHLSEDPALTKLVEARPGLRVPGAWDGFELAMRAICGQQITVPAATRLLGKIAQAHGTALSASIRDGEGLTHIFPSSKAIAAADASSFAMPGARARALIALAEAISADPLIFSRSASLEQAIAKLRALPGIGEWTAQYIAMRELREPDAFPAADVGLLRALAAARGRRPSPDQLLARAERWRPWRAYAALHLWAAGMPPAAVPEERADAREAA